MLASPHFGERWGRRWLDVARFAESSGGGRTLMFKDAWRYRDYVIDAVNRDVPFDTFIREQLAGDLLPAATPADRARQLTATAFLTLGPTNYEEQNKDQLRMDVVDEQLDTLGKAFLGMTLGCARCHDHKFDPVPTGDYYGFMAILQGVQHGERALRDEDTAAREKLADERRRELQPIDGARRWDGVIGPKTVAAAKAYLGVRLTDMRLGFLKGLPTWGTFGRGWANRVNDVYSVVRDLCSR